TIEDVNPLSARRGGADLIDDPPPHVTLPLSSESLRASFVLGSLHAILNRRPGDADDLLVRTVVHQTTVQLQASAFAVAQGAQPAGRGMREMIDVGGVADKQMPPRPGLTRLLPVLLGHRSERDARMIKES